VAPIKRERVRFDNYSTSNCGLRRKNLTEHTFWEKGSVTKLDEGGVLEDSKGGGSREEEMKRKPNGIK
jgi:hypothetical protein